MLIVSTNIPDVQTEKDMVILIDW